MSNKFRKRWLPGGLYWRVSISYFLVTLVAVVIIEGASIFLSLGLPVHNASGPSSSSSASGSVSANAVAGNGTAPIQSNSVVRLEPTLPVKIWAYITHIPPVTFYFLLLAIVVGTLTGLVVTRGLTRRLRAITRAAGAWSQGDFLVTVQDVTNDELGQLAHDLNRMAEQVRTLLVTRQELAVVEERNRLARDLHDSVKQQVFANALLVRAARKTLAHDPTKAQTHLVEAEELAIETQQALVDLIQALRPASMADKGLVAVLQEYTEDWSRRMGIPVAFHMQGEQTTPLDQEEALFRVVQEALANVARHSEANNVELHLTWTNAQIRMTIQDDGHGFLRRNTARKGSGLANMRERIEALAGTYQIASSAAGTCIDVSLPLLIPEIVARTGVTA
jgi:NarL family two-component system sensor histidine kinase LiaS